ncbi:MAG: prepilin-type N-terminal cleavage/methylation domain-containing protein [Planctomycetota bacterium]
MGTRTRWSARGIHHLSWVSAARSQKRAGAFTLVELLVVVAIIALLVSILMPSLTGARAQAQAAACASQMRGLSAGLASYTTESNGWIPGMNTSGVKLRAKTFCLTADALRDASMPVQPHDWATPILRLETALPRNRAERLRLVTERYQCPSQTAVRSVLYPHDSAGNFDTSQVPDGADFLAKASWAALSYLMPAHFQYWGKNHAKVPLAWFENYPQSIPVRPTITPSEWETQYDQYVSHMDYVGPPARKMAFADGTRYLTVTKILDHDVSPLPDEFGSFTSSGAWWSGCTAYGVAPQSLNWDGDTVTRGSPSAGENLGLSYRHCTRRTRVKTTCRDNPGMLNAAFFDGHVELLSDQASRRIELWYPSGAVVKHPLEGMTRVAEGYLVP